MRKSWINEVLIEGYVFNIGGNGQLYTGTTGPDSKRPNTDYISGTINIAVDEEGINVVPVRFNFVTERWNNGNPNPSWNILKEIAAGGKTWQEVGKEKAMRLRLACSVGVNDFLGRDGNMVEARVINCSFAHPALFNFGAKRNNFKIDMLIAATALQEVENGDDYLNVRGYTFDYRGALIPITLSIHNKDGIHYFESQDISNSNPMLTQLWGKIISTTQEIEKEVESAFGAPVIEKTTQTLRAWEIEGCLPEPYPFDDESTLTWSELKTALQNREVQKAEAKQRQEERQQTQEKSASHSFPTVTPAANASKSKDIYDEIPF